MGSCLSKKSASSSSSSELGKAKFEEENAVKKEIFMIKHGHSQEIERRPQQKGSPADEESGGKGVSGVENGTAVVSVSVPEGNGVVVGAAPVRTSSCTKEEVDAILIQCGRLSRSNSVGKTSVGRTYSGSKRSYDFDGEGAEGGVEVAVSEVEHRRIERRRQSQGRRRTPSRERERDQQQRSGSKERPSGGGRRVSRSPGRRSESPITPAANSNSNSNSSSGGCKPGKMVSVPATVSSSMTTDKIQNASGAEATATGGAVRRIQVKRNVSPRARSPAKNVGPAQRKAEQSPYRRNPLAEIDTNNAAPQPQAPVKKPSTDMKTVQAVVPANSKNPATTPPETHHTTSLNVIPPSDPKHEPPLARSRSSRLSCDLDATANPDPNAAASSSSSSSYTALLQDIQNFHQNSNHHHPPPAFSLPPCVTKA